LKHKKKVNLKEIKIGASLGRKIGGGFVDKSALNYETSNYSFKVYFAVPRVSKWFNFTPVDLIQSCHANSNMVVASDDFYILGIITFKSSSCMGRSAKFYSESRYAIYNIQPALKPSPSRKPLPKSK
jgi:hypothetical protein